MYLKDLIFASESENTDEQSSSNVVFAFSVVALKFIVYNIQSSKSDKKSKSVLNTGDRNPC